MDLKPTGDNIFDMHREVSIAFLKGSPAFAVRTPRGQKDPGPIHWNPRANSREKSNETISTIQKTNDNLGVHLFGQVVDIDIDSDNPALTAALDYFLPHTNHIWGRKSRPRTHRLYELAGANSSFDPAEFPFLSKVQGIPEVALEIRGGEMKSGRYSLLPGSVHPSGETYEWADLKEARSTPVQVDLIRLADAVRFACVAALLAPHWTEGQRNDLCKALSGFMHRAASYTDELDVGLTFDKTKAQKLLEGILSIANDDEADQASRLRTFEQTWEKADAGAPVTGATRIGEITGNPNLVGLLYALLAYTPDLVQLEEMFQQYAVVRNSITIIDLKVGARGNYVMNKEAFMFTLSGQYITTPKGRVPVATVFINSNQRTIVDRVGIHPAQGKVYADKEGRKIANIWSGWGVPPCDREVREQEVEIFLDYLGEVVAKHDKGLKKWILMWIADIFQNPAVKPGTALVLVGAQGAGKTFLFENLLRPIIGEAHFAKAGTTERLTSKFNSHMGGKLFIQGEEVMNSNRKTDAEALKDAITSSKRTIEMKGRDSFEMEDNARYGFTSNHVDNALHITAEDRRFTIAHVNDLYAYKATKPSTARMKYWAKMFAWATTRDENNALIPNYDNLSKLHRYLLQVEIDETYIRQAYGTQAKQDTIQNSSRGLDSWLLSMLEQTNPFDSIPEYARGTGHSFVQKQYRAGVEPTEEWPDFAQYASVEKALKTHTWKGHGEERNAQQILKFFFDNNLISSTDERRQRHAGKIIRIREFPKRTRIRAYLANKGYPVMEVTDDEASTPDSF
jgi:hypothetical protein